MINMNTNNRLRLGDKGAVSFMVTMIMILVISLIVLGLAQVSRRNEREALDRQLSSQAYYAAESGINQAVASINSQLKSGFNHIAAVKTCPAPVTIGSAGSNVQYTCVLIDPAPPALQATVSAGGSNVLELKSSDNSPIGSISLTWTPSTGSSVCPSAGSVGNNTEFTSGTTWNCQFGVLRYDVVDVGPDGTTSYSQQALLNQTGTGFLVPVITNTPVTVNALAKTGAHAAQCTSGPAGKCTATLSGLGSNTYFIRMNMMYKGGTVTINHVGSWNAGAGFADSQVQIDSTGKSQDVVRRIRVSINVNHPSTTANGVIVAGNVDKRACTWSNGTGIAAGQSAGYVDDCPYPE